MISFLFRKPLFVLIIGGAILFWTPFQQVVLFTIGPAKVYAQDLAYVALIIFLLIYLILRDPKAFFTLRSSQFFALFFLWGLFSVFRGYLSYSFSAVGESRMYVLLMLYYFYLLVSMNKRTIIPLMNWIILFTSIMVVTKFTTFFFMGGNAGETGRSAVRFIGATETLLVALLLIFLTLFYMKRQLKISNLLYYVIALSLGCVVVIVQTRSVWLAAAAGLFSVFFITSKAKFRGLIPVSLIFLILVIAYPAISQFIGAQGAASLEESARFIAAPGADPTGSWRLIGWAQELQATLRNPLIGQGLGGYSYWYVGGEWSRVAVHNSYIMHFSKFGIAGLLLIVGGLYYWYKEMNRYVKNEIDPFSKVLATAIKIGVSIHLIFFIFYDFSIFFWILLGLGGALTLSTETYNNPLTRQ